MLKKSLISIVILFAVPLSASAAQSFKCSVTHNSEDENGVVHTEHINLNGDLTDSGETFSVDPDGKGIVTSPELKTIKTPDGGQIMTGKTIEGMIFAKLGDSYVMRNTKEGYVYSDCKPASE